MVFLQINYMKAQQFLAGITLIAGLLVLAAAGAAEPREITWDDLVPAEAQFDDPFTRLSDDQLFDLSLVAQVRMGIEAGKKVDEKTMANYRERIANLQEQGVDVDSLIAMREQVVQERIAKTYLGNRELDGESVRMPGYLLPLEFEGDKVTEFFLVPYVGACIHTPPPPPNQIVYVKTEEAYTMDGGLFTPVWVVGMMKSERKSSSLYYVDGTSDIPSSYALEATLVTPYE